MNINRIPDVRPVDEDIVTLKICGNVYEVRYMEATPINPIQKLDQHHGVDLRTGEVVEFRHRANRAENKASVAQSLKRLRDMINTNLKDPEKALWVTLTYATNMTDTQQLYEDYRRFWQRLKYHLKKQGCTAAEYIIAAEPQGRGAWHLHCLFFFDGKAPFIPNSEMARLWGHGFTKTKSLKGVTNPGLYLTAYLGDMELTEAIAAGDFRATALKKSKTGEKSVIKGARMKMYPPGFNLYRCSRGIKRPKVFQLTEQAAQKIVGDIPLTYEKTVVITDESGVIRNKINYRTYTQKGDDENKSIGTSAGYDDGARSCKNIESGTNDDLPID